MAKAGKVKRMDEGAIVIKFPGDKLARIRAAYGHGNLDATEWIDATDEQIAERFRAEIMQRVIDHEATIDSIMRDGRERAERETWTWDRSSK